MNDGTNPKQQKRSAVQSDHRTESVREGFEPRWNDPTRLRSPPGASRFSA